MSTGTAFTKVTVDPFEAVGEDPGTHKPDPILVVDSLTRRFGGLMAVNVDHVEIQRGSITALIGPNSGTWEMSTYWPPGRRSVPGGPSATSRFRCHRACLCVRLS